jgi:hypothetical protein
MASYTEWLRDLEKLPKTAEFCMMDVTERISAGDRMINFLVTEAKGQDIVPNGRRGQKHDVCRPRLYLGMDRIDMADTNGGRIEITEPIVEVEKSFVRSYSYSLHEFFIFQTRLCESVLSSLTTKIGVISERSTALLESQLGDEVVKLVTQRLSGEDAGDASLKKMLITQISDAMEKHIIQPVQQVISRGDATVQRLEIQDKDDLSWDYQASGRGAGKMDFNMTWKGITLHWDGSETHVTTTVEALCVRDTFLYLVNLPSFGQMIAGRLAKIME